MNLAYVAGLFDGEGCVRFGRVRTSTFPVVMLTNTNIDVLYALQKAFGGDVRALSKRKQGWKQGWYWRISWSRAVDFLDRIFPWLRIKSNQASTVFAWDAIRLGSGTATKANRQEYDDSVRLLVDRMRWLNKKGEHDTPDPVEVVIFHSIATILCRALSGGTNV